MQTAQAAAGKPLTVWLTLPVGASGLTAEGLGVLTATLAAKVDLAGVNGMTMDYGVPLPAGTSMADQGELALTALHQQVIAAYGRRGHRAVRRRGLAARRGDADDRPERHRR